MSEEEEEEHHLLRGLLYFLGWVAALEFLHLTAPVNNPGGSVLVSVYWFLLVTISLSGTCYVRVFRAGKPLARGLSIPA